MKFKSRTFLRNFGVLALLMVVVCVAFSLFTFKENLKNELTDARNGLVVITDQTMPNMTGLQLSGKLRQIRPDIPIILCTGFSENANEEIVKTHQVNAFVMKPLLKKDIARVIRNVLDQQNILS